MLATGSPWLAVDPASDRVSHARALRRIYDSFHAGDDVERSGLRAVVARSWERSGAAGIDPEAHRAPILLDPEAIADRWHHHPLFPVLPVLRDLLSDATTQSGHMLVISDADGVLLWIEGHRRVMEATEDMHFVCGADWSESGAGTNALGTALAVDHPVQIFSAEHYSRVVHPWQCSGAPIHDPATGEIVGVVDLTGHLKTAHPHTLSLVTAAAGMAEAYMRQDMLQREAFLRERFVLRAAMRGSSALALVDADGRVLDAVPRGWLRGRVAVRAAAPSGEIVLHDGTVADLEPLDDTGAFVVWRAGRPGVPPGRAATVRARRVELLRARPQAIVDGVSVPLSARHAEILTVLAVRAGGVTAEQLAAELWGSDGRAVSARAELSRLRRLLPGVVAARPYALATGVETDVDDLQAALDRGDLVAAVDVGASPLLPGSDVPLVSTARARLRDGLRRAVIARGDPALLTRWCRSAAGRDDEQAAALLASMTAS